MPVIKAIVISIIAATAVPAVVLMADSRYVLQSSYAESVRQQRAWSLSDRIEETKTRAAIENRDLTPAEKRQIEHWEAEIKKLEVK